MTRLDPNWRIASIAQLCDHIVIAGPKIRGWIERGELVAANIASRTDTRPIWRIRREDFDRFWAARSSVQVVPAKPAQRRRKPNVRPFV